MNQDQLYKIKKASLGLRLLSTDKKNKVLQVLIQNIEFAKDQLIQENQKDVENYKRSAGFNSALLDRLILTETRVQGMIQSLKQVIQEPDPVGRIISQKKLANKLLLTEKADAFGVIFFIFESRPNVITEAFSLGFKSGNALIFKNGKEAYHSALFLYGLIQKTLSENQIDSEVFCGCADLKHDQVLWLLKQDQMIDLVIPRGGDRLIELVKENSRIPVIQNDRGLCHLYVDSEADLSMALDILKNGKIQRPGVCNSLETLLVHEKYADQFLPLVQNEFAKFGVIIWGCPKTLKIMNEGEFVKPANPESYNTEYLSLQISCRVVSHISEALEHIQRHGSKHSEVIVTKNEKTARQFQAQVDAAVVYWNASSRFTDGFEFGLGGEIGISTQKLHVRGPVGLQALTTARWVVDGDGQIRS